MIHVVSKLTFHLPQLFTCNFNVMSAKIELNIITLLNDKPFSLSNNLVSKYSDCIVNYTLIETIFLIITSTVN